MTLQRTVGLGEGGSGMELGRELGETGRAHHASIVTTRADRGAN